MHNYALLYIAMLRWIYSDGVADLGGPPSRRAFFMTQTSTLDSQGVAMARSCRRLRPDRTICYEHTLQWPVIRKWMAMMIVDAYEIDELRNLHNLMMAAMLPKGGIPLDDRPQITIDRVAARVAAEEK